MARTLVQCIDRQLAIGEHVGVSAGVVTTQRLGATDQSHIPTADEHRCREKRRLLADVAPICNP